MEGLLWRRKASVLQHHRGNGRFVQFRKRQQPFRTRPHLRTFVLPWRLCLLRTRARGRPISPLFTYVNRIGEMHSCQQSAALVLDLNE